MVPTQNRMLVETKASAKCPPPKRVPASFSFILSPEPLIRSSRCRAVPMMVPRTRHTITIRILLVTMALCTPITMVTRAMQVMTALV